MILPFSDELEIGFLSKIFDKKNESYKLFWFQAIVNKVMSGKNCLTYDEIINEMIADSWYMVTEYKLNLGPSDTMEALIRYIFENNNIKSNEKNEEIISFLEQCEDKRVKDMKRTLTNEVPYRLQKPFIKQIEKDVWNGPKKVLVEQINRKKRLIYYFNELSGIKTSIIVQQEWIDYIKKNENIIKGWIQYNLIIYLQKRNPNVPGIADKLNPPRSRKLNKVIKYWKTILDITPVYEIFAHEELNKKNLSIDHFVPWSYVAHDEFWNLHPTTKNINSSKNNNLPDWKLYFPELCKKEYFSYCMMWKYDAVHEEFKECKKEHINSDDVLMKLYRENLQETEFYTNLETILLPVYESAKNVGFGNWVNPVKQ